MNKFVIQLLVVVGIGCLAACAPTLTPQPLPTPTKSRVSVPPNPKPATTTLLYSVQTLNRAAPALPTWGLRAWPVTTPFSYPVFDLIYGELGMGENYPGYFFDFRPQPSPNGRYVLIPGIGGYSPPEDPGTGLWLADLQDGSYRQLMTTVPIAVWSPQSDAIAYREGNTLYIRSLAEDATPQAIFTHEELSMPFLASSPDGQWVAVVTLHEGEVDPQTHYPALTQTVWLVSPTGEPARALATLPAFAIEHIREELAWSPDSQYLTLQNYILDLQGEQVDLGAILYVTGVDWLPTASQLLVNRSDSFQIIDVYGNVLTTLNTRPAIKWAFSPDSRRLAYISAMPELNQWELRIFDLLHNRKAGRTTFSGDFSDISLLRWNAAGDLVYFDDGGRDSPIWSLPATAEAKNTAQPTVVVENGLLVEVIYKAHPSGPIPPTADDLAGMEVQTWSSASPDGVWQAEGLVAFPGTTGTLYYTELRVKKADDSAEWLPVAEWNRLALGYTTPEPKHWSPDGRYLYFTNAPVPDGCALFVDASGLQRLDLQDGSLVEVLPPDSTWTLTVAPDGERVAYTQGDELYVLTLATGNYSATKLDMLEADAQWGRIVWAPDSQQLAFTVAYAPCQPPQWRQSIVLADVRTHTVKTLIEKDDRLLTTGQWLDADRIQLHDQEGKEWEMDVATGSTATRE